MGPYGIEVPSPTFDHDLGLLQRVEDLTLEQLVAQTCVEALDVTILPGAAWCDVGRPGTDSRNPLLHRLGDELRPVVGADVPRYTAQDKQVREHVDHVHRLKPPRDPDRQALVGKLVDNGQHAILTPVMGPVFDEVVGPDVVAVPRPQSDAGAVREPQPPALGLPGRNFEPLLPPDPLDPLIIHQPAGTPQQFGDLAIAVAAVLPGQFDNVSGQAFLVFGAPRLLALRRAVLSKRRTGAALGYMQLTSDVLDAAPPARGAQKFPRAASFKISLSSVRSATVRRSRAFSASSSFSRFT